MLAIEINLNVLLLIGLLLIAFVLGYLIRRNSIRSFHEKIMDLEIEMLNNHARILELEKEKAAMIKQMKEPKIPVIPLKSSKEDDKKVRS